MRYARTQYHPLNPQENTMGNQKTAIDRSRASEVIEARQLEDILGASKQILDRLNNIDERLGMMSGRLSGSTPREVAGVADDMPLTEGIIGQFGTTHSAAYQRCDSIDEWITTIEKVV